ncbi:MAG: sulfotransferase family 2 domain-containing protein [Limisphaerales bacterium]
MMIFLHIPKTAGTTFEFVLANSFGFRHCHMGYTGRTVISQKDLDFARRFFPGLRSVSGINLIDPLSLSAPSPYYITFLREPVARVFSHYQDTVLRSNNRLSFEQMLLSDDVLQDLQVRLIAGGRNLDKAKRCLDRFDFVGLTEKFDLSLHALNRLCPHKLNPNYKRKLTARDNSIRKSLQDDPRIVEMTRERNKLDLDLYSFAVTEVFPRVCAKAGLRPSDRVASFDKYSTVVKLNFLLHRLYNKGFFREVCKSVYRNSAAPPAETAAVG